MAGLDVTHKAQIHVERQLSVSARLATLFQPFAELLDFFLEYHKDEKMGLCRRTTR